MSDNIVRSGHPGASPGDAGNRLRTTSGDDLPGKLPSKQVTGWPPAASRSALESPCSPLLIDFFLKDFTTSHQHSPSDQVQFVTPAYTARMAQLVASRPLAITDAATPASWRCDYRNTSPTSTIEIVAEVYCVRAKE